MDLTDTTAVSNNLIHSLFSQFNVTLNGFAVTQSSEYCYYRSYVETFLTYCTDAATSHLTNRFSYLDSGDMQPGDPLVENHTASTNEGFVDRWTRLNGNRDVQLFGPLHIDLCKVPIFLLPGVRLRNKLPKVRPRFYLMKKTADLKGTFIFLEVYVLVIRVHCNPAILSFHITTLSKGVLARYNMPSVVLKTFTFSAISKSLSIENAVLGSSPTPAVRNDKERELNRVTVHNPYKFRHYDICDYSFFVNGNVCLVRAYL